MAGFEGKDILITGGFVNQAFASILPDKYKTVNREQDLGNEGLRKAKLSYKPMGFVKKYRVFSASSQWIEEHNG